jgi:hypothetical protein
MHALQMLHLWPKLLGTAAFFGFDLIGALLWGILGDDLPLACPNALERQFTGVDVSGATSRPEPDPGVRVHPRRVVFPGNAASG